MIIRDTFPDITTYPLFASILTTAIKIFFIVLKFLSFAKTCRKSMHHAANFSFEYIGIHDNNT